MNKIIDLHDAFYNFVMDDDEITAILQRENIKVLDGFIQNIELVEAYYNTVYHTNSERIVLCGINPGKLGAGKTGIPFLDFKSVSKFFPNLNCNDTENSAQFIWFVIEEIGFEKFYENVYLTNESWFGFTKTVIN